MTFFTVYENFSTPFRTMFVPVSKTFEGFRKRFEESAALFCRLAAVSVHEIPQKRADFEKYKF